MNDIERRLRQLPSASRDIMRFHLVYKGMLPASGNNSKPNDVARIRDELSLQLEYLWTTHNALKVLSLTGAKPVAGRPETLLPTVDDGAGGSRATSRREFAGMRPEWYQDCCTPLMIGSTEYVPLVRQSLDLNCELEILFLRQQDPGSLISQGGDIDNRIKLLLDALRMPTPDEEARQSPTASKLYCLMESDTLISSLDVDTDRLLFPETQKPHEVHLVIRVSLNVLQVGPHNMCLL